MCFSKPKVDPIAPSPTQTNIGAAEDMQQQNESNRKKQRSAAGYQQNILNGSTGLSDANVNKKVLLG